MLETFLELCSSRVQMGFTALSWLCANLSDLEPPVCCTLLLGVCTEKVFLRGVCLAAHPVCWGAVLGWQKAKGQAWPSSTSAQLFLATWAALQPARSLDLQRSSAVSSFSASAMVPAPHYLTRLPWSAAGASLWSTRGCKHGFVLHKAASAPSHGPLVVSSVSSKRRRL